MTYFAQQKKRLQQRTRKQKSLGPGSYSVDRLSGPNRSYAPFGSLSGKQSIVKKKQEKNSLGPGSYQIQRDIVKPTIVQYENDKCIIVKINNEGGSQFKSKIERFKDKNQGYTPGPGQYDAFKNKSSSKTKRTKSVSNVVQKMKQMYEKQYQKNRHPTLFSDPVIVNQNNLKKQSKPKGVLRWDLNRVQRFKTQPKQVMTQQQQSIIIDKINAQKNKKQRNSCFFASTSVKSSFDQIIYKTTNPLKVEVRKMLGFNDQSPGPGSYQIDTTDKHRPTKPMRYQFFGSTADRFKTEYTESCQIGPGEYYSQNKAKKNQKLKQKLFKPLRQKAVNQEEQERDQVQYLGPGYYEPKKNSSITHNIKFIKGQGAFGSRESRFSQNEKDKKFQLSQNLEFHSFMAVEDVERKKRIEEAMEERSKLLQKKNHSSFKSECPRDCFQDYKHHSNVPFGIYDIGIQDIGTRIHRQKQYEKQVQQCNLNRPGFLSSVNRFAQKNEESNEKAHKDCWCQIRDVEKRSIEQSSPAFQSKIKRIQVFDSKNKGPAVGQYNCDKTTFIKDSFNTKFIKQNQNITKKLKLWKAK